MSPPMKDENISLPIRSRQSLNPEAPSFVPSE
jgi:hypothetical protein